MNTYSEWQRCDVKAFWGTIAADDHVVQIYDNDTMLLNTLADYTSDGFYNGDSVVVIATGSHIEALNSRLRVRGLDLNPLLANDQYIPLDADETLSKFMINGYPDEECFIETVSAIMKKARKNGREVRAFGEMVALLWERGQDQATMQLEGFWNNFCNKQRLSLFCAYPKNGFRNDEGDAVMHICAAHSKVIGSNEKYPTEIIYRAVV
ncbi:MAG TPA: MEDS domain-containing protein [Mucilaginibacter sp.]|jgi:hypothetical protein|nr:MEDS domain-containing protein [Mucilaginibacter sp.]